MFKRRRVTTGRRSRPKKRSYAMLARPLLNREMQHRHIVTMSTTAPGDGAASIFISQSTSGVANFGSGVNASPNLSVTMSLAYMLIKLGGFDVVTVPNPSVSQLQQLYDTFQIERVELTVFFSKNQSAPTSDNSAGVQFVLPMVGYTVDTDDAANTSLTALQQYSTYKCHQSTSPLKVDYVPCAAGLVFDDNATANIGYARKQKQDISCTYASTDHYGVKMAVDNFIALPPSQQFYAYISIQARVHYLMKTTR